MTNEDIQAELLRHWNAFVRRGDPVAFSRLFDRALGIVERNVWARTPNASEEDREDAIAGAFADLARHPDRYDPRRSTVVGYLSMIAERKVIDSARGRYVARKHVDPENVAVDGAGTNNLREAALEAISEEQASDPRHDTEKEAIHRVLYADGVDYRTEIRQWLDVVLPDGRDQELLRLVTEGNVRVEDFAPLYGLSDLPVEAQQQELKRNRDRVQKKISRNRASLTQLLVTLGDVPLRLPSPAPDTEK